MNRYRTPCYSQPDKIVNRFILVPNPHCKENNCLEYVGNLIYCIQGIKCVGYNMLPKY